MLEELNKKLAEIQKNISEAKLEMNNLYEEHWTKRKQLFLDMDGLKKKINRLERAVFTNIPFPSTFIDVHERKGIRWEEKEDTLLVDEYKRFIQEVAQIHSRTVRGISERIIFLYNTHRIW